MNRTPLLAGGAALALAAATFAAPAMADPPRHQLGNRSLATVLTSDGNQWDKNGKDYDVVTEAALAVLEEKEDSPVGILTKGNKRLTAFIPNDRAFKILASALTGKPVKSEKKAFEAVAGLGIDTVETVLLYHVVPGQRITARQALHADGAKLTTAQGGKITVDVRAHGTKIVLKDKDPDFRNPRVVQTDINKRNKQIAHGINRVLLPVNL